MGRLVVFGILLSVAGWAVADDRALCAAGDGSYLSGIVHSVPVYEHGHVVQGVELSHTRLMLVADSDGLTYEVAIDNLFANGFQSGQQGIPAPLNTIAINDKLELCGALYTQGRGIHFVHTNCGVAPSAQHPDGWLKQLMKDGSAGANLEANTAYCAIFKQAAAALPAHGRDSKEDLRSAARGQFAHHEAALSARGRGDIADLFH